MRVRNPGALLLGLLVALPCAAATLEETEVSQRMTQDATEFLDHILGAGKSKVLVVVEGESSEIQSQTELVTPRQKGMQPPGSMPGYNKTPEGDDIGFYQKDVERSSHRTSFQIKKAQVVAVLDESVPDEQVKTVRALLPQFLRLKEDRSDELVVLKAQLVKIPWSTLWTTPGGVRTLLLIVSVSAIVVLICLAVIFSVSRAARVLALLADRRPAGLPQPPQPWAQPGPEEARGGPDLLAGGLPTLEGSTEEGPAQEILALGHRFDFISSADPADMASLIAKEPPADLALLFAALAESRPDHASRLFALLPSVVQSETAAALLKMDMADPERLAMVETRLKTASDFGVRGWDRLGRILSRLSPDLRDNLLGELMDQSPDAAEKLRRSVFPFEAIAGFKREDLRRLISAVKYEDLGLALRGSPQDMIQKVLAELPAGMRQTLLDALQAQQPKEKVLEARSKILAQAFALAEKGQISLGRSGVSAEMI